LQRELQLQSACLKKWQVLKLDGDGPAGFHDVKGIAAWLQPQLQLQSV
jgi:hypothetical protein